MEPPEAITCKMSQMTDGLNLCFAKDNKRVDAEIYFDGELLVSLMNIDTKEWCTLEMDETKGAKEAFSDLIDQIRSFVMEQ